MLESDNNRVLGIYAMGIATGMATFETVAPVWHDWDNRHLSHSRFVFIQGEKVVGWIALSPASTRLAYKGVAEVSVYIDNEYKSKGVGTALMERVIKSSEEHGIWTLFSSVFSENKATMNLHQKCGFRVVGIRKKIARLNGVWHDTVLLERRSEITGID